MIKIVQEMQRVRRLVASSPERWVSEEKDAFDSEGNYLGRFVDAATAATVCALHNVYLPLCNVFVVLWHKAKDREAMRKEQQADANAS
jgi:hypothetical protein